MRLTLLNAAMISAVGLVASTADAQERGGSRLRLGAGMVMNFAGEIDVDGVPRDDDAKLTPGLRMHLDYELNRYFSLGGFAQFSFWEGDDYYEDRSMWFDIGPRLKGHYDWRDFRFYVALMPGFTISAVDDDYYGVDNPGFGANVAFTPGVEWWFKDRMAVYTELFGWSGHFFSHDADGFNNDFDVSVNQVLWNVGMVFGL